MAIADRTTEAPLEDQPSIADPASQPFAIKVTKQWNSVLAGYLESLLERPNLDTYRLSRPSFYFLYSFSESFECLSMENQILNFD